MNEDLQIPVLGQFPSPAMAAGRKFPRVRQKPLAQIISREQSVTSGLPSAALFCPFFSQAVRFDQVKSRQSSKGNRSLQEKEYFHVKPANFYQGDAGRFGRPGCLRILTLQQRLGGQ
jgi:hypothetical protein